MKANDKPVAGGESNPWQPPKRFTVSPYDFPLTDNAQLDVSRRFAVNLYYATEIEPQKPMILLKLVWFPEGYITERERPINYYEVNRMLGVERP